MALFVATAAVVKVRVGDAAGNGIARIIRRGGVIPEDVTRKQLDHLLSIGFIEDITPAQAVEAVPVDPVTPAQAVEAKAGPAKSRN